MPAASAVAKTSLAAPTSAIAATLSTPPLLLVAVSCARLLPLADWLMPTASDSRSATGAPLATDSAPTVRLPVLVASRVAVSTSPADCTMPLAWAMAKAPLLFTSA